MDEERRAAFEESGHHYESAYHLTLAYLPPEESRARAAKMLYENAPGDGVTGAAASVCSETDRVFDLLDGVMPEIAWLDDSQTLTYLHATVSTRRYRIGVPEVPFHLDALLADSSWSVAGAHAGRPAFARGVSAGLSDLDLAGPAGRPQPPLWLPLEHALCLHGQSRGGKELGGCAASGSPSARTSALLRETIFQQESPLVDTDASNKASDADATCRSWVAIKSPSAT